MKTITLLLTILLSGFVSIALGQNAKAWAQVTDLSVIPNLESGKLISTNSEFNNFINNTTLIKVSQALPASRQEKLQQVYEFECACNEADLIFHLRNLSMIRGVEFAPKYEVLYTPNDYNLGNANNYALDLINAQGAWDISHGSSSIIIGISDQNINPNHEELSGKIVHYDASNTATPTHGNAVSVIAAGKTNNGIGFSSIGFDSKIAFYQMDYNQVLTASYSGIRVVNLSWTSGCFYNQYEQDVVNEIYNNGTFIVAAAGNGNTCNSPDALVYPAAYNHVFAVTSIGATNNHEHIIGDPSSTHQHNQMVDLSAPGYDVAIAPNDGWYLNSSGTSYAAPYVTGTVALMLSVNPCLGNSDIEYILKNTSANIDALNPLYAGKIGSGRLNAAAAVVLAQTFTHDAIFNVDIQGNCSASSAAVSLAPSNVTGAYTVTWSNGMTGINNSGIPSGTYTLHLVDAIGCSSDTTFTINAPVSVVVNGVVTQVQCFGQQTGAIDVSVLQGNPAFNYAWDNGATTQDLSNIGIGTYRLTVTDASGCVSYTSYTVTQPTELILNANSIDATNGNDGSIDLSVSGGVPAYTIAWSNGVITEDQNNLVAGSYDVTVFDANGCMNQLTVVINQPSTNGIDESEEFNLGIYPNPSNGDATINWTGDVNQIIIMDQNGRVVSQIEATGVNQITVNALTSGAYHVRLLNTKGIAATKRLIVL